VVAGTGPAAENRTMRTIRLVPGSGQPGHLDL